MRLLKTKSLIKKISEMIQQQKEDNLEQLMADDNNDLKRKRDQLQNDHEKNKEIISSAYEKEKVYQDKMIEEKTYR